MQHGEQIRIRLVTSKHIISLATRSVAALQTLSVPISICSTRSLSRRTALSTEVRTPSPLASPSDSITSENMPLGFATDASTTKTWPLIRSTSSKCVMAYRRPGGTRGPPTKAPYPTCTVGTVGLTCSSPYSRLALRKPVFRPAVVYSPSALQENRA